MSAITSIIREDDVKHDPFGTALAWQFAIADRLAETGDVPTAWDFRQSMGGADTDDWRWQELEGRAVADLVLAGNVCARMVRLARLSGQDY